MTDETEPEAARWVVHGERQIYESPWVRLVKVDIEMPDGRRFEHHVVRMQRVVGVVVLDETSEHVLLLWRHRFITDTWAWEIPAGIVDPGEDDATTAIREVEEETGWRIKEVEPLVAFQPAIGIADTPHQLFIGRGAEHIGDPADVTEAAHVAWFPLASVKGLIADRQILDAPTLVGLLHVLSFGGR